MPPSGSSAPLRTKARSGHKRKWATHRIATADRTVPVVVLGRHQQVTARPSSIVTEETRAGKTTTLLHVGRACHPIHHRRHGGSRSRSRAGTGHRHAGPHPQPERGPWPPNSPATSTHPPRPSTRPGRTEHPYPPSPWPPTPHRPQAAGHPTPAPTKPGRECVHRCADRPAGRKLFLHRGSRGIQQFTARLADTLHALHREVEALGVRVSPVHDVERAFAACGLGRCRRNQLLCLRVRVAGL